VKTGHLLSNPTSPFATSCPGVFAIGDVRAGSIKPVASAVGEGAAVISDVHRFLEMQRLDEMNEIRDTTLLTAFTDAS
jgi:thioredoxin reductase (NADPH)